MSSFASAASLIVATSDLKAVQAVIGAIRAADLESGDVLTPLGTIEKPEPAPAQNVDRYDNAPQVQPQIAHIKQAVYAPLRPCCNSPRPVVHPMPARPTPVIIPACDLAPVPTGVSTNPIEPPWKVLPWMDRPHPRVVVVKEIKLVAGGSDMSFRGLMIDVVV